MTVETDASGARMIGLQQAADRLGVHYMTVYRYIRTGRLPAVKEAGEWRIERTAVDRLRRRQAGPQSPGAATRLGNQSNARSPGRWR